MGRKYNFGEKEGAYFISFASANWIEIFTRNLRFATLRTSLDFYKKTRASRFMAIALCQAAFI